MQQFGIPPHLVASVPGSYFGRIHTIGEHPQRKIVNSNTSTVFIVCAYPISLVSVLPKIIQLAAGQRIGGTFPSQEPKIAGSIDPRCSAVACAWNVAGRRSPQCAIDSGGTAAARSADPSPLSCRG